MTTQRALLSPLSSLRIHAHGLESIIIFLRAEDTKSHECPLIPTCILNGNFEMGKVGEGTQALSIISKDTQSLAQKVNERQAILHH